MCGPEPGDALPKADIAKSCIRFKRLPDVDLDVITEIVVRAAELCSPPGVE